MSEEKIIDRIKKLLSLANSTNEHEAAMAAGQAAELMLQHEIKEAQLCDTADEPEDVDLMSLDESGQIIHWKGSLMAGLADSMGCKMHYHKNRVYGRKASTSYNVVGQPSKVDTIRYMYSYLVGEVDRLADVAFRQEHIECRKSGVPSPSARSWKNSFRLGAAHTIATRLRAQREETHAAAADAGQGVGLMVIKKAEEAVGLYMKQKFPRMRRGAAASHSSSSGYGAGASAGKGVGLGSGGGRLGAGAKQLGGG